MAVRRKIFRIEQASGRGAVYARNAEAAPRHDEFMAEIRALRSLIEPHGLPDREALARASRELEAIVSGTEQATQQVLQAAEDIDQTANTLSAALKSVHEQGLASDIRDRVVQIFEACNFQDLTGQRVGRVVDILAAIEEHVGRLMEIWRRLEQFKPAAHDAPAQDDRRFLNGPRLSGDAGHSSQDDIDALFGHARSG